MSGASGDANTSTSGKDDNRRNPTANMSEANGDAKTTSSGKKDNKKPEESCSATKDKNKNKKEKVGTLSVLGGILGAMAFQQAQSSKKKK